VLDLLGAHKRIMVAMPDLAPEITDGNVFNRIRRFAHDVGQHWKILKHSYPEFTERVAARGLAR